jgi:hypothetical protein
VDLVSPVAGEKIAAPQIIHFGLRDGALARQDSIDRLLQRKIMAGDVAVPDLVARRIRGQLQPLDVAEGDIPTCDRVRVIKRMRGHVISRPERARAPPQLDDGWYNPTGGRMGAGQTLGNPAQPRAHTITQRSCICYNSAAQVQEEARMRPPRATDTCASEEFRIQPRT